MKRLTVFLAALVMLLAAPGPGAGAATRAALSPDDSAAIERAVRYLNNITTLRARFVQISSNGTYAEGDLLIARPGRLRFEYDPPNPALIIANGLSLLFYDRELKEASFLPLWETPLWFLIREKVELSDTMRVATVERARGTLRIALQDEAMADAGTVTLVFSDRPLALRKWEIVDAQGILTEVSLLNPRFGVAVDPSAFDWSDLKVNAPPRPAGQ